MTAEFYTCAIEVIHVVSGGNRNWLLNQLTADATGRPGMAGPVEATALGNVLVQARAAGDAGVTGWVAGSRPGSVEVEPFAPAGDGRWANHPAIRVLGGQ